MEREEIHDSQKTGGDDDLLVVDVRENPVPDWTKDEELRAKRKVDFTLLPILALAFFALQCDRGNIANALTDTITEDLGVTTNQINVGTSVLSAGIVLLEIPSNILLQKIGPRRWLSFQIIAWGLVATFQAFVQNYAGYLVTRVLLGFCESGFIPGALYTMSTWYKKSETSLRVSIFFLGNIIASATVSLIGAGILSMGRLDGLSRWRWLFIIEGVMTLGIGIIFILFLPPSVGNGRPLISFGKWSYFNEREEYILVRRVLLDDPGKSSSNRVPIHGKNVWETVHNPRILVHVMITLTSTISVNAVQTYSPSIIKSLGFSEVKANAMFSVGNFVAAVLVVLLGLFADYTGRRGPATLIAALWALIAYACLYKSVHWAKWHRYSSIVFANATNSVIHIINVGWLSVNCQFPQQRSIAMAMIIMAANAAGIAGGQVFRTGDAPLYIHAFSAMLSLAAVCVATVLIQISWYYTSNMKLKKRGVLVGGEVRDGSIGVVGIEKPWIW